MQRCDYGCGRPAIKYYPDPDKWCCSPHFRACPAYFEDKLELYSQLERGELACRTCDMPARYILYSGRYEPCCEDKVKKCPGWTTWRKTRQDYWSGPKSTNWRGGDYRWWHVKARELYRKDNCERCNMSNFEHIQKYGRNLYIHNPTRQYRIMSEDKWHTYCCSCHRIVETEEKNERIVSQKAGFHLKLVKTDS